MSTAKRKRGPKGNASPEVVHGKALALLRDCTIMRQEIAADDGDPADANVYVLRRDVNVCDVELVLEALGIWAEPTQTGGGDK